MSDTSETITVKASTVAVGRGGDVFLNTGNGLTERLQTLVSPEMQKEAESWVETGIHTSVAALVRAGIEAELARLRAAYPDVPAARKAIREEMLSIVEKGIRLDRETGLIPASTYDDMEKRILERLSVEAPSLKATVTFDRGVKLLENGGALRFKVKID